MTSPAFTVVQTGAGEAVTYDCGCPCEPKAAPQAAGTPGFEHCCCGKVHFVGDGAATALDAYLAERRATRRREPDYDRGQAEVILAGLPVPVAWAFPIE